MLHSPISAHPSSEVITAPLCLHKYYSFIFLFCHDFFHQLDQSEKMTNIAVHHPEISSFKSTTQMVHAAHSHTLKSVTARLQSQYYLGGSSRTETARSTLATEQESSTPKWKGEKRPQTFCFSVWPWLSFNCLTLEYWASTEWSTPPLIPAPKDLNSCIPFMRKVQENKQTKANQAVVTVFV